MRLPRICGGDPATAGLIVARIVVGLLGVAGLVVGLYSAWESESASVPLIVGAVLVVLAWLVGPDLEELSARFKDSGFTYRRARREELLQVSEALVEVSAPSDGRQDPAAQLSTVRSEIRALAERLESEAQDIPGPLREAAESARRAWSMRWGGWAEQGIKLKPDEPPPPFTYDVQRHEGDASIYTSYSGWLHDWRLRCTVITPSSEVATRVLFGQTGGGTFTFMASYPRDFPGAPPVRSGEYEFRWSRLGKASAHVPLAIDRLTIEPEYLTRDRSMRLDLQRVLQAR